MAATNCPETPRQKMIGMMYLFYTALLALNVSSEILTSFVKINESIQKTTSNYSEKTKSLYAKIDNSALEQPGKYTKLAQQAHEVERQSNEFIQNIEDLKLLILRESQGPEATLDGEIKKMDDLHAATIVMVGEGGPMMGKQLRGWLDSYRELLLGIIEDTSLTVYKNVAKNLEAKDQFDNKEAPWSWEETLCRGMPMIGTMAMLSKLQADIRNSEADVLEFMIAELEGLDIRITALEALVSSPRSFVIRGGKYSSNVFLGARDTSMRPTIYLTYNAPFYDSTVVNGEVQYKLRQGANYDTLPIDESGKGLHVRDCGGVGDFNYGGLVHYKSNKGDMWLPYKAVYQVGDAGFTVSASACNVFYRGLDNPVEVAVSGYPQEAVSVSISGGASISRSGAGYIVKVPASVSAREVSITVSVRTEEGVRTLGSKTFSVLNVPPPTIVIAGAYKDGASVPKGAITRTPTLTANLESDFFPFKGVSYSVISYEFLYSVRGVTQTIAGTGSNIPQTILNNLNPGSAASFTNIRVSSPSGERKTNGITVKIQ
ncbi:MAG TPA: gliding motility protein GldM [Bacteroidales bacterium]|jgi:gliding motility-associated protein GldM|nr:gliding motility protein GldM [Bacteroidales bacterium]